MKIVCKDGMFSCSVLTDEEVEQYKKMPIGVKQTTNAIYSVAENEEEKQILEITADGVNRIRIPKNQ